MLRRLQLGLLVLLFHPAMAVHSQQPGGGMAGGGMAIQADEHGYWFREGDRRVLYYRRDAKQVGEIRRAHYVHPVLGLDGQVLTQEFPADHPHHQGVFWAWHQLWVGRQSAGDPWVARDFLVKVQEVRVLEEGAASAAIEARAQWTSPLVVDAQQEPQPIVEEVLRLRVHAADGDTQYIDFHITLTPRMPDVRLGGADNERGYSGFTVRVRPPQQMQLLVESGTLQEDLVGQTSRWAAVSGHWEERPAVLAILAHSQLPEFPPRWLLRFYGMQNVVYPGREPVQLSADQPLVLRHRLVIARGSFASARIPDHQNIYQQSVPIEDEGG